jgi:regulator of protease activity HflC (stomatin/prohibitin superfamily)
MLFLLIIGIIALIAGLVMRFSPQAKEGYVKSRTSGNIAIAAGIVVILAGLMFGSFTNVPAGTRGVVIRFGAVTGRVLEEGLRTKVPFLDSVVKMSVQTQKYTADAVSASKDLQDVNTTIVLNWHLDPSMADDVYRDIGLDFIERLAAPAIQETVKQVTAKFIAEDLILKRDEVKNAITINLSERLLSRGIVTETVSITNFRFSETFTAAIEAKVSAEQAVLEARNKLERVKVEAQQAEEVARGVANARIAAAEGEAEYIRIVTDAQIAANNAIASSLTPEILKYILIDRLGENIQVMVIPSDQGLDLVLPDPTLP